MKTKTLLAVFAGALAALAIAQAPPNYTAKLPQIAEARAALKRLM